MTDAITRRPGAQPLSHHRRRAASPAIAGAVFGIVLIARAFELMPIEGCSACALVLSAIYMSWTIPAALAHRWASRNVRQRRAAEAPNEAVLEGRRRSTPSAAIALDGKPVRTPGRAAAGAADRRAGRGGRRRMARGRRATIDPRAMPLTGLANAAIERVAADPRAVRRRASRAYGESDLLCYRAEAPRRWSRGRRRRGTRCSTGRAQRYDVHFEIDGRRDARAAARRDDRRGSPRRSPRATPFELAGAVADRHDHRLAGLGARAARRRGGRRRGMGARRRSTRTGRPSNGARTRSRSRRARSARGVRRGGAVSGAARLSAKLEIRFDRLVRT